MARVELSSAFIAATLIAAGTARAQVAPARLTDWLELTYSLARDLNSGLAAIDRNGDRVTSDVDILLAVHDDVLLRETPDLDEDGVITAADVLLSIRHYIVESLPDPTVYPTYKLEDGVAILLALEEGGDVSELVDVNKDGVVSIEDYFELFEKLGQPVKTVDVPFILAQQIFNQMGWAIDIGIDVLRTAQVVLHNPEISNTWQTPANPLILPHRRHNKDLSRSNWPANHSAGVSINWNRDPNAVPSIGHQQATSASWPAEHSIEFSSSWTRPQWPANHSTTLSPTFDNTYHSSAWSSLNGHSTSVSSDLPATHTTWHSSQWATQPNHRGSISIQWPAEHQATLSRDWPANHLPQTSSNGTPLAPPDGPYLIPFYPATHAESLSAAWPLTHLANYSKGWPTNHDVPHSRGYAPNHLLAFSGGWPEAHVLSNSKTFPPSHQWATSIGWGNHAVNTSALWPATHVAYVSRGWPQIPPIWPANHVAASSTAWYSPTPGVPLFNWPRTVFPLDHSWFTTVKDAIPGLPATPAARPPAQLTP